MEMDTDKHSPKILSIKSGSSSSNFVQLEFLDGVRVDMYGGGGMLFLGRGHGKTCGSEKGRSPSKLR